MKGQRVLHVKDFYLPQKFDKIFFALITKAK
jgi:hypothetical protein